MNEITESKTKKIKKKGMTEKQLANLIPFKKGDPRINRKGVPADAIAARKFIQDIGAELVKLKDDPNNKELVTLYEQMIRRMYKSKAPRDHELILKASTPGLLKDEMDLTSNGEQILPPTIIEIIKTYESPDPDDE